MPMTHSNIAIAIFYFDQEEESEDRVT